METLVIPPVAEPLTVSELKSVLRIDTDGDDALLQEMAVTARTFLERRLDRAFLRQTWRHDVDGYPCGDVSLRPGGAVSVTGVVLVLDDESTVPLSPADWTVHGHRPTHIVLPQVAPCTGICRTEITFQAGALDANDIPADLLRALYLLTAHYYEEREVFRSGRYVAVPLSVDALIEPYREVRL